MRMLGTCRRAALIAAICLAGGCSAPPTSPVGPEGEPLESPEFVGRTQCATCHAQQSDLWRGSHHDLAMQVADASTVLGDFDDATLTHGGVTTTFYRRDGEFWVRTDGPDGQLADFQISYTFGVAPLQQYLVKFPKGRLQALSVCWDTRPQADGGQRWFHLYPDEVIGHQDELHWTGPNQNWNFMCAECHSTGLRKGYTADTRSYSTSWSEIDVSCEACHGPGSAHVAWAEGLHHRAGSDSQRPVASQGNSRIVALRDDDGGRWQLNRATGLASRSVPRQSRIELETCARCHSRRAQLMEGATPGAALLETHRLMLLDEGLYYADGQMQDEVYAYGSFLQSRMYAHGVTCGDCHDPHSLQLRSSGSGVCAPCHAPARFDDPSHHFHEAGSPGASCVDCHMPTREYMVVDPRHDHSFRIPRPDLSVNLGTPNACNDCHADRTPSWAENQVAAWYGDKRTQTPHFAEALDAGRQGLPGADARLQRLVNGDQAGIVRATAATLLRRYPTPQSLATLTRAAVDEDPLVRLAVANAAAGMPPEALRGLIPLLNDPMAAVRMEAASALATLPQDTLTAVQAKALKQGLTEYRRAMLFNSDRPESHLSLGLLSRRLGQLEQAERHYRDALELAPTFVPGYVNLADLYHRQARAAEGESVLRRGLAMSPGSAVLHHALGLHLVRDKRGAEALPWLEQAAELAPGEARYSYVLGIALQSTGQRQRGLDVLRRAHDRHPNDRDLLTALVTSYRDAGALEEARSYSLKLRALAPQDP